MRVAAAALASLCLAATASGASALELVVLPAPAFPGPVAAVSGSGPNLQLVSSREISPVAPRQQTGPRPPWAPRRFRGANLQLTIRQGGSVFLVYGRDGATGRYLVGADARTEELLYAYDFAAFGNPPSGSWFEPVTWARAVGGVLYVETTHLTFASATGRRNAYVSAIDLGTHKTRWRSRALVANARTFVVTGDLIVAGYGFTAEPDYLYLLDRRTGRVLDRLAVPSGPEVIKLRGGRLHVRTYDHDVVARIVTG